MVSQSRIQGYIQLLLSSAILARLLYNPSTLRPLPAAARVEESTHRQNLLVSVTDPIRKIALTCWSEPCRGILGTPGVAMLESLGHHVTHINLMQITSANALIDRLEEQDAVIWWNWGFPQVFALENIAVIRNAVPHQQVWCVFNWDDPHSWGANAHPRTRQTIAALAAHLDLAYTTGSAVIDKYLEAGTSQAKFVMVPYSEFFHYYDPDPEFNCDINFVATNYYDNMKGLMSSRRGIVEALTRAADLDVAIYGLKSSEGSNASSTTSAFKGGIPFETNRKVFSSCKLTLNLLVAATNECLRSHKYANERVTTAMASGAVMLVERHPCLQGVLEDGNTAIFLKSTEPAQVVSQVREIISNFDTYKHIREQSMLTVQKWHLSSFINTLLQDMETARLRRARYNISSKQDY